jgi:hypothetical protein
MHVINMFVILKKGINILMATQIGELYATQIN